MCPVVKAESRAGNNVGKRFRFLWAACVPPHLFPEPENRAATGTVYVLLAGSTAAAPGPGRELVDSVVLEPSGVGQTGRVA